MLNPATMTEIQRATAEAEARQGLRCLTIPARLHDGLLRYVVHGHPVGHFLTACIDNDLREAVSRGDDECLAAIKAIVQFFYNYTPAGCHGSPAKRVAWQTHPERLTDEA